MAIDRVDERARRFRRDRLLASLASLPTFAIFTLVFAAGAIFGDILLCRIGCAMIAASLAYAAYRFFRSDWGYNPAGDQVARYREHLVRRRDFLQGFVGWGAIPIALGVGIATLGWLLAEPSRWADAATAGVLGWTLPVALWASNKRTAAQLQREIDALPC